MTTPTQGTMDFTTRPDLRDLLDQVRAFIEEDVLPAEHDGDKWVLTGRKAACGDLT